MTGMFLETAVGGETIGQTVEIHQMAVELRTIHAGEFCHSADHDPAAAAHAGAVDHDWIEADKGLDAMGPGQLRHGPHHRHRSDCHNQLGGAGRIGDQVGQFGGNKSFAADTAVLGGDQQLIRQCRQLIGQDDVLAGSTANDGRHLVASSSQGLDQRIKDCGTDPAADAGHPPPVFNMGRLTQRTGHVTDAAALGNGHDLARRGTDGLNEKRNGACSMIGITYGQGNTFSATVGPDNNKLARLACQSHARGQHHHFVEIGRQDLVADYFKHVCATFLVMELFIDSILSDSQATPLNPPLSGGRLKLLP